MCGGWFKQISAMLMPSRLLGVDGEPVFYSINPKAVRWLKMARVLWEKRLMLTTFFTRVLLRVDSNRQCQ